MLGKVVTLCHFILNASSMKVRSLSGKKEESSMFIEITVLLVATLVVRNTHAVNPKKFLINYGYLNPYMFNGGSEFSDALKLFQRFYGLRETGIVDDETKKEMAKSRCGVSDIRPSGSAYFQTDEFWSKTSLTYRFLNFGQDLNQAVVETTIQKAFDMWSAVTPLQFRKTTGSTSDFTIGFYHDNHSDNSPFDGVGGVLAHAFYPENGRIHFDEAETWGIDGSGMDLLWVAVHEIGHAIGLGHSNHLGSIMWPSYGGYNPNIKLHDDDIAGIQSLYGSGVIGAVCDDIEKSCVGWKKHCATTSFVRKNCRNTCGLC